MCIKEERGLEFRDLHSFNLAMSAKQCWRLLQNPESLCAQVLSAKYYPDGNILNAGPKKGSSYTWQSIVSGIWTFQRGDTSILHHVYLLLFIMFLCIITLF